MNTLLLLLNAATLILLFLLSAFFSGSETVFFSLSPVQVQRVRKLRPKVGQRLDALLKDPAMLLSTILVGNTLVNFAIASLSFLLLESLCSKWAEIISIPLVTILLLIFGEVTPKRIAIDRAESLAPFCTRTIVFFCWLLRPMGILLKKAAHAKVLRKALVRERQTLSDDELMTAVKTSGDQGILDADEVSMVDGIMRLSELKASDEMIPRTDMVGLDLDTPRGTWVESARKAHHRYLPVYRRTPDAIEGFLNVVQFLLDPGHDLKGACFNPLFVPENMPLDKLLVEFQTQNRTIACVLDEYGGTAGIITRGDILEWVSAPIRGTGAQDTQLQALGKDTWVMDGTASLEEINRVTGLELVADDSDRISGWITFHTATLPRPGMTIEAQGCRVTVLQVRKRRVSRVKLLVLDRADDEDPETDEIPESDEDLIEEDGGRKGRNV